MLLSDLLDLYITVRPLTEHSIRSYRTLLLLLGDVDVDRMELADVAGLLREGAALTSNRLRIAQLRALVRYA